MSPYPFQRLLQAPVADPGLTKKRPSNSNDSNLVEHLQSSAARDRSKLSKHHHTGVSLHWSKRLHPSALPKLQAYRGLQQAQPVVHGLRLCEVIDAEL